MKKFIFLFLIMLLVGQGINNFANAQHCIKTGEKIGKNGKKKLIYKIECNFEAQAICSQGIKPYCNGKGLPICRNENGMATTVAPTCEGGLQQNNDVVESPEPNDLNNGFAAPDDTDDDVTLSDDGAQPSDGALNRGPSADAVVHGAPPQHPTVYDQQPQYTYDAYGNQIQVGKGVVDSNGNAVLDANGNQIQGGSDEAQRIAAANANKPAEFGAVNPQPAASADDPSRINLPIIINAQNDNPAIAAPENIVQAADPTPAAVEPTPTPVIIEPDPAPIADTTAPSETQPVAENPTPAAVEPAPPQAPANPAPVVTAPANPQPTAENPTPAAVEPAPTPTVVPADAVAINTPAITLPANTDDGTSINTTQSDSCQTDFSCSSDQVCSHGKCVHCDPALPTGSAVYRGCEEEMPVCISNNGTYSCVQCTPETEDLYCKGQHCDTRTHTCITTETTPTEEASPANSTDAGGG